MSSRIKWQLDGVGGMGKVVGMDTREGEEEGPNPGSPGSPRLTGLMQIFVEISGKDETIKMDVKANDTIASGKDKIKSETSF